ncbi:transcription initiation factor TFIID subunit 2-like [Clavelina lepadiformis]|uniref:transcription initiation factor TFIID subunit 2-like n=1 Tax=Clavelina lepadiformis TaxID=159417 RepID=UPI004041166E
MEKKPKKTEFTRPFKLSHQLLAITSISFESKTIIGHVELMLQPRKSDVKVIKINTKQARINRVGINGYETSFQNEDPSCDLTQRDPKSRNLEYLSQCHLAVMDSLDADSGYNGELSIRIPSEVMRLIKDNKPISVTIFFSIENPKGGIHFIVPEGNGTMAERAAHLFTYGHENSARLWFPCVDTYSEPCTWKLEYTVDESMTAVSCGDLVETVYTTDKKRKTFHYILSIPTAAPNICLAVGPFEILVDPHMHEVTHFCLPQLMPVLEHTTQTTHEIIEFFEEVLSFRFPYSCYKQVFVDETYQEVLPYASVSLFNTNLLFSKIVLDQTPITRKVMGKAIAEQFFGCFMSRETWKDYWVPAGISGYLYGLWLRSVFGNSEYRHWIALETEKLCQYETREGPLALHHDSKDSSFSRHFPHQHPHTVSLMHYEMMQTKAHLIMRQIENRIGPQLLLQAFNKLLSLANTSAQQKVPSSTWSTMLLSQAGFLKSTYSVSGKDISNLFDQWVNKGGVICFNGKFVFNRKRNAVELDVRQDTTNKGTQKYVGPLTVRVQELDGSFKHTIQIEENTIRHDLPCHSKSRRNKRKKIPLLNGEEADIDLNVMDPDSPVLWIRIDPDVNIPRLIHFEQPDYMWQYQVKFERDVVGQLEAIKALEVYPTAATRTVLNDIVENKQFYYKVREEACLCLAKIANAMLSNWTGPPAMFNIFTRFFCCDTSPPIIRMNDFANFQQYFIQKKIPIAMSLLKNANNMCPKEVVHFLLDLIKFNDNSKNQYLDNYYRAVLVDSLSNTITPATNVSSEHKFIADLMPMDIRAIVDEVTRCLNLEKHLPSYKYTVTVSCLRAIRNLQKNGHLPPDANLFKSYALSGFFYDVRLTAVECLVDLIKATASVDELNWLLDLASEEPIAEIKRGILHALVRNPPFVKGSNSPVNNAELVERLWRYISQDSFYDSRLRCMAIDLYHKLFGKSRPMCLPAPKYGVVVNLKERKTQINPNAIKRSASAIYQDFDSVAAPVKLKKPASMPVVTSHSDEQSSKIKMKIKFGTQSQSNSTLDTDDVMAAESLISLSHEFDTESIQYINLGHQGIQSIESISECKNIIRLNLSFNRITFLNPLKELKTITFLNLSSNHITNLDPLSTLETLEELNVAGNMIGSCDRLRCLTGIVNLQKLRLQDRINNLTNPVCHNESYHSTTLSLLSQLLVLDGERVKGRGSELYKMCTELDKQLQSFSHGQMCPCDACKNSERAGRTFGPVAERPSPEPWLKKDYFSFDEKEAKVDNAIKGFEKVLSDCKKLDQIVASKINELSSAQ